jgi:hypothetical protein
VSTAFFDATLTTLALVIFRQPLSIRLTCSHHTIVISDTACEILSVRSCWTLVATGDKRLDGGSCLFESMAASTITTYDPRPQWRIRPAEPPKEKKDRQRTWHHKVKSGCSTCKRRKVRCDEGRPSCQRCTKAGYDCGGYLPPKIWLFEGSKTSSSGQSSSYASPSSSSSSSSSDVIVQAPSLLEDKVNVLESRALQYFQENTAPLLSPFAPSATHFWTNIVPRVALHNSTIRSALIAVSSLHESQHYRHSADAFPLARTLHAEHYHKTITALTRADEPPSTEVVLITCFIFIACENFKLVGSAPAELMHVQSGLKVLREWKARSERKTASTADSSQDIMNNVLEPMFARLEAQTYLMRQLEASRAAFNKYDLNWSEPKVPNIFSDLFTARDSMHDIMQYLWFQTQLNNGPLLAHTTGYKRIASLMDRWETVFKPWLRRDKQGTLLTSTPAEKAIAALHVHYVTLKMSLDSEAFDSLLYWDRYEGTVEELLDACQNIISQGPPAVKQPGSLWLYDFCLSPPLLLMSRHCRNSQLRHKAVRLLRLQHLWDGEDEPWDVCWSAKLSEMVVEIEEQGLKDIKAASDVPESRRVRPMTCHMAAPGEATIYYQRWPFIETRKHTVKWASWTKPPIEELMMWPFGEQVKHGQFQGLIRPHRTKCMCKSLGAPVPEAWNVTV